MWVTGLLRRRRLRLAGAALGVALAVAFLASLGAFFAASKARMTKEAVVGVPVDWQVQLAPGASPAHAAPVISAAPGVVSSLEVGYGDTTGLRASAGGTVQTTGPGKVVGLPPGYASTFPGEVRPLLGATDGVLLAQQTAANLHAAIGTVVSVGRPGLRPVRLTVQGVVDLPAADSFFQAVGAAPGAAPQAPPDNVMLLPSALWHRVYDPVAAVRPDAVRTQFHVNLAPSLPPDPAVAFTQVVARAHNLEAKLAGTGLVGNNLGAQLDAARSDSIYAQLLFLFLGVPGVVLAGLFTAVIGAAGGERRRREQALLRMRGASPRQIVRLAGAEAALAGVVGVVLGLAGAAVAGRLTFGTVRFGGTTGQALLWGVGAAVIGLMLSFATILLPAWRDARNVTVQAARSAVGRSSRPLWARLYLDLLLLAAAGLVYWQVVKSGYQVVLAPEGVATISVSYVTFLAPLFLWIGAALFAWRVATGALSRGRRALARFARPLAHGLSGVVAASMSRQSRLLSRGLTIMALTGSFAVSTAVFNATYAAQSRVDAQLTNGADVMATTTAAAGLPTDSVRAVGSLPGVAAVQPMQHRFAYVSSDLQDLFGIDPATIGQATPMSDAFFAGGHATQVLAKLASRPDAVLVSDETVRDFQLQPGDLIRLRLQFASDHAYHIVPFHYVGIVREFPTAPHDSFFVANASYVARATGSAAYQTLLVRTNGSPPAVAAEVRRVLGPASGATVHDIVSELKITLSGLTAIDLSGLTRLELAFAFILAAAASGLVLALGLVERRRTFAIASALGARQRQLAAFVWSEAVFVSVGGAFLGVLTGYGLSYVIVKILTGVFDPPPEHLFIPFGYLAVLAAVTVGAILAAGMGMIRATRRPAVEIVRDL
ncbi:MAG TPA: FtsX-like permease family protein [Actinomycetota bacterium]|nr:FtsX-like permease family protein [Actinomycetota bacterium]